MPSVVLGPLLRHVDETSATVWVETDAACEVQVLGCSTRTFSVAGHHYALVICGGLVPGSTTPYTVVLDGEQAWPLPDDPLPPPTVRTRTRRADEPLRLLFGSCRVTRPHEPPWTGTWGARASGRTRCTRGPVGCCRPRSRSGRTPCCWWATRSTPTRSRRRRSPTSSGPAGRRRPRGPASRTSRSTPCSTGRRGASR